MILKMMTIKMSDPTRPVNVWPSPVSGLQG